MFPVIVFSQKKSKPKQSTTQNISTKAKQVAKLNQEIDKLESLGLGYLRNYRLSERKITKDKLYKSDLKIMY